ncbi:PREDICTED: uncharacterized protein LOC105119903 [Populus euphratica]|uniref:Uncharacterized protein LOC105119903 n=1 Tax=Populus euphratica TaxID=75702 RepID=A0AAJ6XFA1_POPEU|nr:PREDICTED: uncharacterized protein LOC105119903 [Populus euphratica]
MQSPCLHLCKVFTSKPHLGFYYHTLKTTQNPSGFPKPKKLNMITLSHNKPQQHQSKARVKARGRKENVWSIDNDMEKTTSDKEKERGKQKRRKGRRVVRGKRNKAGEIMVSGTMLMEVETVLQTQEPVIRPVWNTFTSSVSGIWKGVGAVFSPITAEMEPIEVGSKNENLYDCYTLARIEAVPSPSGEQRSQIQRKINWVTLNPYGEVPQYIGGNNRSKDDHKEGDASLPAEKMAVPPIRNHVLPGFESFNFETSDLMEEDVMGNEPGLVFFEDGSYSRGPVDIPVGEVDDSNYYLSPTFKFEQCLVKGCHKRLRIVHTIEFNNGGSDIQIMRVAVYEEEWVSPANLRAESDLEFEVKPFSQRKRTQPSELTGPWKVFEMSATPIFGDEIAIEESNGTPYVYLCTETLKKRSLPDNPVYFGEEEIMDMQDVTVLWLPGGVTGYVDVSKDGILCIGVGWYSDEGINLVMERDYGLNGKLREVRWKSEVKRRWPDSLPV